MRKINNILSFALAVFLALGCSESPLGDVGGDVPEEVPEDTVAKEISFMPVMKVLTVTKSPVTTLDVLKSPEAGFGVNAVYTKGLWSETENVRPEFMYDRRVSWDGGQWSYAPVEYWPNKSGEKVSFFAWAPYGAPGITICDNTSEDADPSRLHFALAERSDETTDFVAASAVDNSEDNRDHTVRFVFRHELTRMEMFAKVDEDLYMENGDANKTRVIVKSARFTGPKLYTEADYLFNTSAEDAAGSWSFEGVDAAAGYPVRMCGESVMINTREPYEAEHGIVLARRDVEYQLLVPSDSGSDERYVCLIPPGGMAGAAYGDVSVEFEYDILTEDEKLMKGYSCVSAVKVVSLPAGTLKPGYKYKFRFTFCLDEVKLDASVVYGDGKEEDLDIWL